MKTCYKLMLWFWWGWSTLKFFLTLTFTSEEHSQSTQNSKFASTLYNISKKVRNGVHFEHADKHWSFYKLALLVLREVARQKYHNYFCVLLWCKASRYFARVSHVCCFLFLGGCGQKWVQPFRSWNSCQERIDEMGWFFCMVTQIIGWVWAKMGETF